MSTTTPRLHGLQKLTPSSVGKRPPWNSKSQLSASSPYIGSFTSKSRKAVVVATSQHSKQATSMLQEPCGDSDLTKIINAREKEKLPPQFSKIRVGIRIRPQRRSGEGLLFAPEQKQQQNIATREDENGHQILSLPQDGGKTLDFTCDAVFQPEATQQDVYESLTKGLLEKFTEGTNICVFAYGQTGSGKTHSIMGKAENPGMLPRFCHDLFQAINSKDGDAGRIDSLLEMAFYEIYREQAFDLLATGTSARKALELRRGALENLMGVPVNNVKEVEVLCHRAMSKRAKAATLMNEMSSRSHAVFQLTMRRNFEETLSSGETRSGVILSHCYFVDLAGSEKLESSDNQAETTAINRSLLSLRQVIQAKAKGQQFVNFRDSLLTQLLKECFGGNSATALLATVSAESQHMGFTRSTLRFAADASLVRQTPKVNVDPAVMELREMKVKYLALREEYNRVISKEHPPFGSANITSTRSSLSFSMSQWQRPEPPCVVELIADESLNDWIPIPKEEGGALEIRGEVVDGAATPSLRLTRRTAMDGRVAGVQLEVLKEEVALNGRILVPNADKTEDLSNGDRIAIDGRRFFVFLGDESEDANARPLPSYHQAKLEYVEATAPIFQQRLLDRERHELEEARRELETALTAKIDSANMTISNLRKQLERECDGEKILNISRELERIEEEVREDAEAKKDLHESAETSRRRSIAVAENELSAEAKRSLMQQKSYAATANNIATFFCGEKFHFELHHDGDNIGIRIRDSKKLLFADISSAEFIQLYNRIVEVYQSASISSDGIDQFECAVYGSTWTWRKSPHADRRSNFYTAALLNSMYEVATKRRSSLMPSGTKKKARRSAISQLLEKAGEASGEEESPLMVYLQQIKGELAVDGASYANAPLTHLLLEVTSSAADRLKEAVAVVAVARTQLGKNQLGEGASTPGIEYGAIHAINRLRSSSELLHGLSAGLERHPTWDHIVDEISSVGTSVYHDAKRWIVALAGRSENADFFVHQIEAKLKRVVRLIGSLSFYRNEDFPSEDGRSDQNTMTNTNNRWEEEFQDGVKQSIKDACTNDAFEEVILFRQASKQKVISILFHCIRMLYERLCKEGKYDSDLDIRVLRPLIFHKNTLIQKRGAKAYWSSLREELAKLRSDSMLNCASDESPLPQLKHKLDECLSILDSITASSTSQNP